MAINIKNPTTEALARELAALTGEGVTAAIGVAVQERRDRILAEQSARAERLMALSRRCADRIPARFRDRDLTDDLYDADGLPR